jgi:polysaccharide pyruvyl transferase WcaK-like protein
MKGVTDIGIACHQFGFEYIKQWFPDFHLVDINREGPAVFKKYDRIIYGGGGTVFEYRKGLSWLHEMRKMISDYRYYGSAYRGGTRFVSLGLGIGPFADKRAKRVAMRRLKYHDLIFTRDQISFQHAKDMSPGSTHFSVDVSFAAFPEIMKHRKKKTTKQHAVFVARHFKYGEDKDGYLDAMIRVGSKLKDRDWSVKWALFQSGYDDPVLKRIQGSGESVWVWEPERLRIADAYGLFAGAGLVVTARLHAMYVSAMLGIPCIGIDVHQKVKYAASSLGYNCRVVKSLFSEDELFKCIDEMLNKQSNLNNDIFNKSYIQIDSNFQQIQDWIVL